ncbi:acyltransferase [Kiritimatiellaeota bacterium B1221]|nr:acyltransferase [Kiritimatiellaeota bacterium B1221]
MKQQIQKNLNQPQQASWKQYAQLTVGSESIGALIKHEVLTGLLGNFPGALGLWLRRKLYPCLFAECGRGLIIGRNVTLRGTKKILMGANVAIDDGAVLDARGDEAVIVMGDRALVSRNSILRSRNGRIEIGEGCDIGANCILATDSKLLLGKKGLVAAFCYIIAGGNHVYQDPTIPIIDQGFQSRGGVEIGPDVWLGSHCAVMDGVTIGRGTVVGAHSLVNKELPEHRVAWGSPAKVQKRRGE